MKKIDWLKAGMSVMICLGAGWLGSLATTPKIQFWYMKLDKPFFNPPNWVFGPVWTLLYLVMAYGFYKMWREKNLGDKVFRWFWIQLVLNTIWSWVFFGWENLGLGVVVIIALWWAIFEMRKNFKYQLPYQLWVSFAMILNISIWWMNK